MREYEWVVAAYALLAVVLAFVMLAVGWWAHAVTCFFISAVYSAVGRTLLMERKRRGES